MKYASSLRCGLLFVFTACAVGSVFAVEHGQDDASLRSISEERLRELESTHLDFDKDPDGNVLEVGVDVSTTYIKVGCELATSITDSYPSVVDYVLRPESGMSCGNHTPKYRGTLTLRFCRPGVRAIPATVKRIGFAISFVQPRGTRVEYYDLDDKLIGIIETDRKGLQFIGVESETPIAIVKIVPTEDPDFAIDDVQFDPPTPVMR